MSRRLKGSWRRALLSGALAVMVAAAGAGGHTARAALPHGLGGFKAVSSTPWLDHGRQVVLFIAAQYCPFCAAERWALVLSLSRFGQWSHLGEMRSTDGESGFPRLATYDLLHAGYSSAWLALQEREVADFDGQPLQPLTDMQRVAVDLYDKDGSIPLFLLGGRYAQVSSGYSPGLLVGLSFARAHHLIYGQPSSALGRAVSREATIITALLCADLGSRAAHVAACGTPDIKALLAGR